jgi:DNA modification methylase
VKILKTKEIQDVGEVEVGSILCGDCLEIMTFIPDRFIDMILTDLPYG